MRMRCDVAGRVALITGGSGGIGYSIGKLYAENGMRVILTDVKEELGISRAQEIRDLTGGDCVFMLMDLNNRPQINEVIDKVIKEYGRIDVLVNNAGVNTGADERKPVYDYKLDVFNWVINPNLHNGLFYISHQVIPYMIKQGGGNILNTTSVCGVTGLRLQQAFVASKFGMSALTKSMAMELAQYNIRVNALAPGPVWGPNPKFNPETDMDNPFYERFTMRGLFENIPANRPASSEEMAGLMLYLASDDATYTTGQVICVDGGWTAGYSMDY